MISSRISGGSPRRVLRIAALESKRHSILVVHPDAVASLLVALERFEAVRRRVYQEREVSRGVHAFQLPGHDPPDLARDAARRLRVAPVEQVGRGGVRERPDHGHNIT
jgi:hypothetical protein